MIINDDKCTWINQLSERTNVKMLNKNTQCDYLIIGAGYTGLSCARKIVQIKPNKKIRLVDYK